MKNEYDWHRLMSSPSKGTFYPVTPIHQQQQHDSDSRSRSRIEAETSKGTKTKKSRISYLRHNVSLLSSSSYQSSRSMHEIRITNCPAHRVSSRMHQAGHTPSTKHFFNRGHTGGKKWHGLRRRSPRARHLSIAAHRPAAERNLGPQQDLRRHHK